MLEDLLKETEEPPQPPPLTKAEKKKLKIQQKKAQREELIRQLDKQDLQREIDMAKKTYKTAGKKWKEICMKEGRVEFREKMVEQWCLFEHAMDNKDKLIEQMTNDLDDVEHLRSDRLQQHVRFIDNLLSDFFKRIAEMKSYTDDQVNRLLKKRHIKLQLQNERCEGMEDVMKTVLYLIRKQKNEQFITVTGDCMSKVDEENNKNQSDYERLCLLMDIKMQNIWKEYTRIATNYETEAQIIKDITQAIRNRVESEDAVIHERAKKIAKLAAIIRKYKDVINKGEPLASQLKPLRLERDYLNKLFNGQKKALSKNQQCDGKLLKYLIGSSNDTLKYLQKVSAIGEQIVTVHEICKKLETKKEKSEPFAKDILFTPSKGAGWHGLFKLELINKMVKFWKRVGRADMIKDFLSLRCRALKKENAELKLNLKNALNSQHLSSILQDIEKCQRKF